uniref:Uncharacterized protein n=1 Tax=Tetraselmis sp. GSL018 TaxID=582737 RepID=A0A061S7Z5_9CHLO
MDDTYIHTHTYVFNNCQAERFDSCLQSSDEVSKLCEAYHFNTYRFRNSCTTHIITRK